MALISADYTSSGSVLGIDVGYSPSRRSSAACRLDWTGNHVSWIIKRFRALEPERSDTIGAVAAGRRLVAAAFDGPLRQGFDVIGRYRTAERMLTRRLRPLIGKPGQSSAPVGKALNAAANDCVYAVLNRCKLSTAQHEPAIDALAIGEAFPSSFMGLMIEEPLRLNSRRGDRSDVYYEHLVGSGGLNKLIQYLLPGRSVVGQFGSVRNHDDRAALVCGLTALCVAAGQFVAVGDQDGWIILPPDALIQPWAREALSANAAESASQPGLLRGGRGE